MERERERECVQEVEAGAFSGLNFCFAKRMRVGWLLMALTRHPIMSGWQWYYSKCEIHSKEHFSSLYCAILAGQNV